MKQQEPQSDELQKVLALKRHEQPPPRFFNSFSDEVIDRLNHPTETRHRPTWAQRMGFGEDWKPLMVGVVAVVGLVLVVGLVSAWLVKKPEPQLTGNQPEDEVYAPAPTPEVDTLPPGYTPVEGGDGDGATIKPVMVPEQP